jgi:bifunctional DNA-binding transcriptional regulator/antitoxin component of YhaV-PrlF toxin-antitoxin module
MLKKILKKFGVKSASHIEAYIQIDDGQIVISRVKDYRNCKDYLGLFSEYMTRDIEGLNNLKLGEVKKIRIIVEE